MRISDWSSDVCSSDLLVGEKGLDRHAGAVAVRHRVAVRVDLLDQAERIEIGDHALARFEQLEAAGGLGHSVVQMRVAVEDVDHLQEIGRESCWGSGGKYLSFSVCAVVLKTKNR